MQQAMSQWCWAACVSMIYAYNGIAVSQPRIVQEVYGGLANLPSVTGYTIAQRLNGSWIDDRGVPFTSQVTAAYDPQFGVRAIGNAQIVSELANDRPLVIGARTHAMILTMVQYLEQPTGPNIVNAGVFDPWPGQGPRLLQQDEITPVEFNGSLRFLAAIRVTRASSPTRSSRPGMCAVSAAPAAPPGFFVLFGLVAVLRRRRAKPRSS